MQLFKIGYLFLSAHFRPAKARVQEVKVPQSLAVKIVGHGSFTEDSTTQQSLQLANLTLPKYSRRVSLTDVSSSIQTASMTNKVQRAAKLTLPLRLMTMNDSKVSKKPS